MNEQPRVRLLSFVQLLMLIGATYLICIVSNIMKHPSISHIKISCLNWFSYNILLCFVNTTMRGRQLYWYWSITGTMLIQLLLTYLICILGKLWNIHPYHTLKISCLNRFSYNILLSFVNITMRGTAIIIILVDLWNYADTVSVDLSTCKVGSLLIKVLVI